MAAPPPQAPAFSERLRQRLEALGVSTVQLSPDGTAAPMSACRWIERVVLDSAPFGHAVQSQWSTLSQAPSTVVEIWPGLVLVPLPAQRRRRLTDSDVTQLIAAMLVGPALLESEQFRQVCDASQLAYQSACARVDREALVEPAEAERLAKMLSWMEVDVRESERCGNELDSLSSELAESYEELSLLYKLSSNMTVNQPATAFLVEACGEVQEVVELKWIAIQLVDEPRLEGLAGEMFLAGAGATDGDRSRFKGAGLELIERLGHGSDPLVVDDTKTLNSSVISSIAQSLLAVPLRAEGRTLGVLFGGDKLSGEHLDSVDAKLCNSLANSLSIFLENRMLYDDMQAMFLGTLHALTSAIDAKDSYTHGHSERVALMSRKLAEAAGLDAHQCERVYIAGLVHDVGKIGVPEAVLCKPGRLTDHEFDLIKMHPEIGGRILADIRQMQDLIPGVLYHHERWDGRGYPRGLAGGQIPLLGRLIGLADAFDAMSSNRTYRSAIEHEQVLAEIRQCEASQFDPELAELFVNLDFLPFFELIEKHHRQHVDVTG